MALQIRRGTDADWENTNQNIVAGEPAIALDTGRFFVGTDDGEFAEFANVENYYDKDAVDDIEDALQDSIDAKADASSTYTKTQVDSALALKADEAELDEISSVAMVENSASGQIASFEDGSGMAVTDLLVGIEAKQNLNGYENPWAGGGGKNICPPLVWKGSVDNTTGEYSVGTSTTMAATAELIPVNFTNNPTYTFSYDINSKNMIFAYNANNEYLGRTAGSDANPRTFNINSFTTSTTSATGDPAYIRVKMYLSDGAFTEDTIANGKFQIEAGDTASTFEPYTNVCPISGWSGAWVKRTGANLCGGDQLKENILGRLSTGVTVDEVNKTITFTASAATVDGRSFSECINAFEGTTRYTGIFYGRSTTPSGNLRYYYTNNSYDSFSSFPTSEDSWYTRSSSGTKTLSVLQKYNSSGSTTLHYDKCGIFKGVVEASDFVPYVGVKKEIDFGRTVYGGSIDFTTGLLTITHILKKVSDLTWSYASSYGSFRALSSSSGSADLPKRYTSGQVYGKAFCSHYDIANVTTSSQMVSAKYKIAVGCSVSTYNILINDPSFNEDASAFKSAMGDCEIVYELVTPQTYQLTPVEVQTLLGKNNIFADCGDIKNVTYKADTKLYIDNAISGVDELLGSGVIE